MRRDARRRLAFLVAGVLTATILCGTGASVSLASSGPMKPASNLVQATSAASFVHALLRDAPVPAGGTPVVGTAGVVDATGIPLRTDLLDVHEVFTFTHAIALAAFLAAHRPEGATLTSGASISGSGIPDESGFSYSLPFANRHVSYEELDYSLTTPSPGRATLRIDAQSIWVPVVTVTMPVTDPVVLTGYDHLSLAMGPSGKVSVTLSKNQARHLARVISLLSNSAEGTCAEDSDLFVITTSTRPSSGAASKWTGTGQECPGVLDIAIGARRVVLDDTSCTLRTLLVSDFPAGAATATRTALQQGCPD